ncbi:MAG TPA: hypothetical protein VGG01_18405 [Xanthobacteraceae bacterium]|jgi:hypothetical protein
MRVVRLAAALVAALTLAATPAAAGYYGHHWDVFYGIPPYGPPPIAYLDPSDPRGPVYVADQGPVIEGPGIYAYHEINVPTWADGGYAVIDAYGRPFPYVHRVPDARFIEPRYGFAREGTNVYRRAYVVRHRPYARLFRRR